MSRLAFVACTALVCSGCIRSAIGTLTSDRPGFSDSPGIIPGGRFQLETGYTYNRADETSYQSIGELLLRSGIARRLELRAHLNSYALRSENSNRSDGLEDSKIGMKYVVSAKSKGLQPELSVITQAGIPTGSETFTQRRIIPEAKLVASWGGNSPLSVTANAGVNWGRPNERDGFAYFTTAGWTTVKTSVSVFAELYSTAVTAESATESTALDGGMTWALTPRMQLDVRVGGSIRSDSPGSFFGAGFVARW